MQHHFHNRNGSKNDAASTTKSAISQGTITTTKEHLDVNVINRNTQDSLNKLGKIFDKKKAEERQELAQLFAKNADELLHYYDRDGKIDKVAAHGLVAEITSQIAGNKAGNGFISGAANEALINKIKVWSHGDPAKAQWISAALGATVNGVIGKSSHTGSAVAQYGTKWNELAQYTELTQNNTGAGDDTYDANTGEWTQDEDNSDIDKNESNSNDDGSNVEPTNDTSEGALGEYISSVNQNQDVFSEENSGPVVIAKGYQASDGAELEYLSDGTIQPTGKYIKNDDSLDNTKTTDTSNSFLNNLENSAISSGGHALFVKGVEEGTVIATSYNPSISIQDAVTFGKSLGGKAIMVVQGTEYVQHVIENHQQFENGSTELEADALDAAPIGAGIVVGGAVTAATKFPKAGLVVGLGANAAVRTGVDKLKKNLKEQEEEEKQKKEMNP
jgi:hypothetical protein